MAEKVILAYSGGLDTSCILKWLIDKGYEVICYCGDVGQPEDFEAARQKALKVGASKVYVEDLRREFVTDFIFPAIQANAIYENRYLLGTSLARPCLGRRQVQIAEREGCHILSHGATGKGNDQVRFELTAYALCPNVKIIAPWRENDFLERFQGRSDLMAYAKEHGIPVTATPKRPYSTDENLYHTSYESGILEDPACAPTEDMFQMTKDPVNDACDKPERIEIEFKDGMPIRVTNLGDKTTKTEPLELFLYLNELGGRHGVGRIDIVENRFVGIKSRGVYETPGGTILREAHLDIEGIAMDREVMKLRNMLSPAFSELVYNGFWFSPEMDFLMAAVKKSQELIDGTVELQLYRGCVSVRGRSSPSSLYNQNLASMELEGDFNPRNSEGFIKTNAVRLRVHQAILKARENSAKA